MKGIGIPIIMLLLTGSLVLPIGFSEADEGNHSSIINQTNTNAPAGNNTGQQISDFVHDAIAKFKQERKQMIDAIKNCREKIRTAAPENRDGMQAQCNTTLKSIKEKYHAEREKFKELFEKFRENIIVLKHHASGMGISDKDKDDAIKNINDEASKEQPQGGPHYTSDHAISKTNKDGVIVITDQSICVPNHKTGTNGVTDKTAFDVVSIDFPSSGSGASLVGVTTLSSSKGISTIPFPSGALNGHYSLAKNSTIVNCGIAYCKGENCDLDKELRTSNLSVFVNDTKGFCPICNPGQKYCPMMPCRGPYTSTDMSISAPSPSMEQGIPYTYKFYLVDSLGKYEAVSYTHLTLPTICSV